MFDLRARPHREKVRLRGHRTALVAQRLLEAEGVDRYLPGPAAHGGRDLAREERCRRAREEDLHPLRIEHPAHEPLPARNDLDLVEAPSHGLPPAQRRVPAVVLLDDQVQVPGRDARELLVLEVDVMQPLAAKLMQERRLPRPAHTDHCGRLPRQGHPPVNSPRRPGGKRRFQRLGELLREPGPQGCGARVRHVVAFRLLGRRNWPPRSPYAEAHCVRGPFSSQMSKSRRARSRATSLRDPTPRSSVACGFVAGLLVEVEPQG